MNLFNKVLLATSVSSLCFIANADDERFVDHLTQPHGSLIGLLHHKVMKTPYSKDEFDIQSTIYPGSKIDIPVGLKNTSDKVVKNGMVYLDASTNQEKHYLFRYRKSFIVGYRAK
ncbi:hypothetical protein [Algicola sagamiensis]|uniref:hypothetical protein n=1 Tax=Algicola sagamiensis TaxID=163869 RepID=UPI00035C2344|nr:hypothetical protein [Algicola sagamiensis]